MKQLAAILLIIFTLVQAGPAIASLFTDNTVVFLIDEEKDTDKTESEKKIKKYCSDFSRLLSAFNQKNNVAFHLAEKIHTSPVLEMPTPPPDFY